MRIVGYLLRKTLGWCDANGNPQKEQIEVSYSELEHKAGVSRDMIRQALDDALAGKLIECVREGKPKLAHDAGQSASYSLHWSNAAYTTKPADFSGFFEGEGNRTDIPNEFFNVVIPHEPLSVIKGVGSVIRYFIGFQTKHGRRRQQVALSFQHIQNYARFGSRSDLVKAVRIAMEKHYIFPADAFIVPFESTKAVKSYASIYKLLVKLRPSADFRLLHVLSNLTRLPGLRKRVLTLMRDDSMAPARSEIRSCGWMAQVDENGGSILHYRPLSKGSQDMAALVEEVQELFSNEPQLKRRPHRIRFKTMNLTPMLSPPQQHETTHRIKPSRSREVRPHWRTAEARPLRRVP